MEREELERVLLILQEDVRRLKARMDRVSGLVEMIPNPLVRKLVRDKIRDE